MASGLLQAVLGLIALFFVWRFDLRDRFEVLTGPGSLQFDPGIAILTGAAALVVYGLAFAAWSAVA